jgi:hypothetical protein
MDQNEYNNNRWQNSPSIANVLQLIPQPKTNQILSPHLWAQYLTNRTTKSTTSLNVCNQIQSQPFHLKQHPKKITKPAIQNGKPKKLKLAIVGRRKSKTSVHVSQTKKSTTKTSSFMKNNSKTDDDSISVTEFDNKKLHSNHVYNLRSSTCPMKKRPNYCVEYNSDDDGDDKRVHIDNMKPIIKRNSNLNIESYISFIDSDTKFLDRKLLSKQSNVKNMHDDCLEQATITIKENDLDNGNKSTQINLKRRKVATMKDVNVLKSVSLLPFRKAMQRTTRQQQQMNILSSATHYANTRKTNKLKSSRMDSVVTRGKITRLKKPTETAKVTKSSRQIRQCRTTSKLNDPKSFKRIMNPKNVTLKKRSEQREEISSVQRRLVASNDRKPKLIIDEENLILKPVYHAWLDLNGNRKHAYGIITRCFRRSTDAFYSANFYSSSDVMFVELQKGKDGIDKSAVDKKDVSYVEYCALVANFMSLAFKERSGISKNNFRWIIPTSYIRGSIYFRKNKVPCIFLQVTDDIRLVLAGSDSEIENAGHGLFIYCEATRVSENYDCSILPEFTLEAGNVVDLGVYGPLIDGHRKPHHIMRIKNFIHNWKCEAWSYDASAQDKARGLHFIDITDDITGEPCMQVSPIGLANDTVGNGHPTISAMIDPDGRMHYYLGHENESHGPLHIPNKNNPLELKMDYGSSYERVRYREGYSRLNKYQQKRIQRDVESDDPSVLAELKKYSWHELQEIYHFLTIFVLRDDIGIDMRCRLCIAWLTLVDCLKKKEPSSSPTHPKRENIHPNTESYHKMASKNLLIWWPDDRTIMAREFWSHLAKNHAYALRTIHRVLNVTKKGDTMNQKSFKKKHVRDYLNMK